MELNEALLLGKTTGASCFKRRLVVDCFRVTGASSSGCWGCSTTSSSAGFSSRVSTVVSGSSFSTAVSSTAVVVAVVVSSVVPQLSLAGAFHSSFVSALAGSSHEVVDSSVVVGLVSSLSLSFVVAVVSHSLSGSFCCSSCG